MIKIISPTTNDTPPRKSKSIAMKNLGLKRTKLFESSIGALANSRKFEKPRYIPIQTETTPQIIRVIARVKIKPFVRVATIVSYTTWIVFRIRASFSSVLIPASFNAIHFSRLVIIVLYHFLFKKSIASCTFSLIRPVL